MRDKTVIGIQTEKELDRGHWTLFISDRGAIFSGPTLSLEETGPVPLIALPKSHQAYTARFFRDGASVRTYDKDFNPRTGKEEVGALHGWYLAGDYSTRPPRVVIVKEPTKFARWVFVGVRGYDHEGYVGYLKNENDLSKDAWLCVANKGTVYGPFPEGQAARFQYTRECRGAILSFEKKIPFFFQDVFNDGK